MSEKLPIFNNPVVQELWAGIGGHFDSLGQIINEFIDNSISNFVGNNTAHKEIRVALIEKRQNESYEVEIEDTGTGIKDLDAAFTLGSQASKDSPLNEHGFGLKRISDIVSNNNGIFHQSIKNNIFIIHIILPLKEDYDIEH